MKKKVAEKNVKAIKDRTTMEEVQAYLKDNFGEYGVRNYTIFQVGKATLLRVSDVLNLKQSDVYDDQGNVKRNAEIHDIKTGKRNTLYLSPVRKDLEKYHDLLVEKGLDKSEWLFPAGKRGRGGGFDINRPVSTHTFYVVMQQTGEMLGFNYLGTHTMRKTGAYMVYQQRGHNIGLVMKLLNHSSEETTLAYIGLDREDVEDQLDKVDFG